MARGRSSHSAGRPKGEVKHLKSLMPYLRPYRWHILAASIALMFTSSAVLGMGGGLRYLVDEGLGKRNTALLDHAFWLLMGVTIVLAVATYTRFYLVSYVGERFVADLRRDVFRHLMTMHIGYFEVTSTGELLSRMTADAQLLQTVIGSSLSVAARNTLLFIGGFTLLLFTSARLTGYIFLMVPVVVIPIIVIGRRVRHLGREAQQRIAAANALAEETLNAMRTVQSLTLEPYETMQYGDRIAAALQASMGRISTRAVLTALVIFLVFGAINLVLWIGGENVLSGTISTGQLSAFVFYSVVVAGAVGAISEVWTDVQAAAGAAERLSELLCLKPELVSPLTVPLGVSVETTSMDQGGVVF